MDYMSEVLFTCFLSVCYQALHLSYSHCMVDTGVTGG